MALPARGSRPGLPLLLFALLLGMSSPALGEEKFCSDAQYNGVIDGNVLSVPPTQITIDRDCTFQNWPQSNPLTTTVNFQTNDPSIYLIIFDNVIFTGHMACASVDHRIWFSNGADYGSSNACQDLFIPVETIDKKNPAGQSTAAIGVPFTYTLTLPSMSDVGGPSANDLHSITITDDLTATGADLTYVSHRAYLKSSGTPVALAFTNPDNKHLTFEYDLLPAGEQIVLELTVVLDNTPANAAGTQFTNLAKWWFGRLIEGQFYEPLPGEWGVTQPMTIAEPNLVVTKSSDTTALNLVDSATFTIDVENVGGSDAWNATILDQLRDIPGVTGMCPATAPAVSAGIFAANGAPVSGTLAEGIDYSLTYSGTPTCQLSLTMLDTPAAKIGPDQHLIITYDLQLDPDTDLNTGDGVALTNVAGATQWFNGASSITDRRQYDKGPLTDGTPGFLDFQDSATVTTALSGYYFQKTVANLTSGVNPASTAAPGDRLRYRLRLFNITGLINGVAISDTLDPNRFDLNTFDMVSDLTAEGAAYNFDPVTGLLQIYGSPGPLDLVPPDELVIEFDITLKSTLTIGTVVDNQAALSANSGTLNAYSDDPFVNGIAPPGEPADPTRVVLQSPGPLAKANTQASATIGEQFTYRITVPATPTSVPLYDVRILDDLSLSAADMRFVGANEVSGGNWALSNTGSATGLVIEDTATGIDIPAGGQAVIEITVELQNTTSGQSGLFFRNSASYTYNRMNGNDATRTAGGAGSTVDMAVVEPAVTATKAVRFVTPAGKTATDPAASGDVLEYTVTIPNSGNSTAFDISIVDTLPANVSLVPGSATARVNGADVSGFVADPTPLPGGLLAWGDRNGDETLDIPAGQSLVLTYQVTVGLVTGTELQNSVYVDWTSLDGVYAGERTGAGCPAITAPDDYCYGPATASVTSELEISFVKSVVNVTTGEDPGANARPGETLRYTLVLANESMAPLNNVSVVDELAVQFAPGSLQLVAVPAGADSAATNPTGGANGTGILDVRNLTLAAKGEAGDALTFVFEATLSPVIQSGTAVLNQALLTLDNQASATSNQTSTLITSAPAFEVWKTSQDITGDPAELTAGDTLRYTITVKNIGSENAVNTLLRDHVPANTTYVGGSTTLNGSSVADPAPGIPPLQGGLLVHAPEDVTAGAMRADATATTGNVATVTFDVVINADVVDGAIITNQGFVNAAGAGSGPAPEEPSDDPDTPTIPDDPTRDVVGNVPLVDAHKTVQILLDGSSLGVVDRGDVLRYTIAITNAAATPATGVVFTDAVPLNTTYVPDSVQLNGLPVGQPDGGDSPLASGIDVSSSDLTPPLPGAGNGILSPRATAVITFDVRVNDNVDSGTLISNQGVVSTRELPDEPTDADGIDANGDQPTEVVVGDVQQLSILKEVSVVGGSTAEAGRQLEYVIRVTNIGSLPATGVVVTDDLGSLVGQVSYVAGSGSLNGSTAGVTYAGSVLTANCGDLPPGAGVVVRFRVQIDAAVAIGTTITNTGVVTWNEPAQTDAAVVSLDVGGTPGSGVLGGSVWHDASLDRLYNEPEMPLEGWSVELYRGNQLLATVPTDASGAWRLSGLTPNVGSTEPYELRFRAAGAGPNTAHLGYADSPPSYNFNNGSQRISSITVASGGNLQGLNLPITPNGSVYNSVLRTPVAGARLAMVNSSANALLPSQCFDDPAQQNQVTALEGFYKFDLNFSDPTCPPGATYLIEVTPPASGFVASPSQIIPPNGEPTAPFSVPACPSSAEDAVPTTGGYCEVTASASVPPLSIAPRTAGTTYHLHLMLSNGQIPGESQLFNNHIPIDPDLDGAVAITKTSSLINVTKGQLVPYTITVNNILGVPLFDLGVVDRFPAGFKYVEGSARFDGNPREPLINGRELVWDNLALLTNEQHSIQLLLVVGSGVSEGEYANRAQAINTANGQSVSGEASATVRVIPDPDFDCTDVIGKVFDDCNLNGYQDDGEEGLPGVRVATARGLVATTDEHGRFHITCAVIPDEDRGSNFILKLDDRSLPTGFRLTTENPRVLRATRGKMLRFNFGATIHRVVGIDIADGVYEPDTTELRIQWTPKIAQLVEELKKSPAVLRLSYLAEVEHEGLVRERLKALKKEIARQWEVADGGYRLDIETEVFWRRGGPPSR